MISYVNDLVFFKCVVVFMVGVVCMLNEVIFDRFVFEVISFYWGFVIIEGFGCNLMLVVG